MPSMTMSSGNGMTNATHSSDEKSCRFLDVDVVFGRRLEPRIEAVLLTIISHFFVIAASYTILHLVTLQTGNSHLSLLTSHTANL